MKNTIIITLIALMALFSANAQMPVDQASADMPEPELISADMPLENIIEYAKSIDPAQLPQIPRQVPFLGSDENINFHLQMNDGMETVMGVKLRDKKVTEITDRIEDWTLRVDLTENTLEKLMNSDDPLNDLRSALKNKEIKIQGKTFGKKVKAAFFKFGVKVSGWFS